MTMNHIVDFVIKRVGVKTGYIPGRNMNETNIFLIYTQSSSEAFQSISDIRALEQHYHSYPDIHTASNPLQYNLTLGVVLR